MKDDNIYIFDYIVQLFNNIFMWKWYCWLHRYIYDRYELSTADKWQNVMSNLSHLFQLKRHRSPIMWINSSLLYGKQNKASNV